MNITTSDVAEWSDLFSHIADVSIEAWLVRHGDVGPAVEAAAYDSPAMFAKFFGDGTTYGIAAEDLAEHACAAWTHGADVHLDREAWRELFDLAGYREDDEPTDRPTDSRVLWRGAVPEYRTNWSWSDSRDAAVNFASGWVVQELGLVWRAVVEPERHLAKINHPRCAEIIIDTNGLVIEPDGLWCRCPVDLEPFRFSGARIALDLHELVTCARL